MSHFESQNDSFLSLRMAHSGSPQNDSKSTRFVNYPNRYILAAKAVPKVCRGATGHRAHIPLQTLTSFLTEWLRNNYSSRRKRPMRASVNMQNKVSENPSFHKRWPLALAENAKRKQDPVILHALTIQHRALLQTRCSYQICKNE